MTEATIRLDLATVTLGEMAHVERLSGQPFSEVMATRAGRMMAAIAINDWRTSDDSGPTRSWQEIADLRLLDVSSSTSPSSPAGRRSQPQD